MHNITVITSMDYGSSSSHIFTTVNLCWALLFFLFTIILLSFAVLSFFFLFFFLNLPPPVFFPLFSVVSLSPQSSNNKRQT